MARRARGGATPRQATRPAQPARRAPRRGHLAAVGQPLPQWAGLGRERPRRARPTRAGALCGRLRYPLCARPRSGPTPATDALVGSSRTQTQRSKDPAGQQPPRIRLPGFSSAMATLPCEPQMVCPRRSEPTQPATATPSRTPATQPLDPLETHRRGNGRSEPAAARLVELLPLPAKQPRDGQTQLAGARPNQAVVVAQTRQKAGLVERLPRRAAAGAVWPVATARAGGVEKFLRPERTERLATKRPGKPDTGNPSVRFDEGRKRERGTDNYGQFNPRVFSSAYSTGVTRAQVVQIRAAAHA